MTWNIFISLVSCTVALISIGGVAVKVTKALTENTAAIDKLRGAQEDLKDALVEFKDDNKETHKEFYKRFDDHERRIVLLEGKI